MRTFIRKIRRMVSALLDRDLFMQPDLYMRTERHGSDYGGWVILADSLRANSTVISAGLGHDISFDSSLIRKYGCRIAGYDPDTRAYAFHKPGSFPEGFEWRHCGLSDKSGKMKLYKPQREDWSSGTLVPGAIRHSSEFDEVDILDVVEVLKAFPGEIDVLKMDIEGAEYAVVERLIASGEINRVRQLLIEFHHGRKYRGSDTRRSVENILREGFQLFFVSEIGHEFSFCRKDK